MGPQHILIIVSVDQSRPGPSASEVHQSKMEELVKSLSHIQHVLNDPAMREVIGNLAPDLLRLTPSSENKEVENAKNGLPSSARPGGKSRPRPDDMPPPPVPAKKVRVDPGKETVATPPSADDKTDVPKAANGTPSAGPASDGSPTSPASAPEDEINSSTHRAEYARLSRRMEKVDAKDFPQMHKLWAAGRRETWFSICIFFCASLPYLQQVRPSCATTHRVNNQP